MEKVYLMNNRAEFEVEMCTQKIIELENELDKAYRDENNILVEKYYSELENLYDKYRYFKLKQLSNIGV